jgi:hypothetical protein
VRAAWPTFTSNGSIRNRLLALGIEHDERRFTLRVHEEHIDGRFKELALHALRQHLASAANAPVIDSTDASKLLRCQSFLARASYCSFGTAG